MKKATATTCIFLDIGGGLLTNGWDHHARKRAATYFKLDLTEMEIGITWPSRSMFVQIAEHLGSRSILHTDYISTRANLALFGLRIEEGLLHDIS